VSKGCATLDAVEEFHRLFEIPVEDRPTLPGWDEDMSDRLQRYADSMAELAKDLHAEARIHGPRAGLLLLRLQLLQEELAELAQGMASGDLRGCLDALADLRYVQDGTTLSLGLGTVFMDAFREVHRSNMSKLEHGRPVKNEAGRVVKGRCYTPPDLQPILEAVQQGV